MAFTLLAVLALLALKLNNRPEAVEVGKFSVVDGDSLKRGDLRYRLLGIDAPELRQQCRRDGVDWSCGQVARDALADLLAGGEAECRGRQRDRYDRLLVTCRVAGRDVNADMVGRGLAVAYGDYEAEEAAARAARAGLWSGSFERPRDYRREPRAAKAGTDPLAGIGDYVRGVMGW